MSTEFNIGTKFEFSVSCRRSSCVFSHMHASNIIIQDISEVSLDNSKPDFEFAELRIEDGSLIKKAAFLSQSGSCEFFFHRNEIREIFWYYMCNSDVTCAIDKIVPKLQVSQRWLNAYDIIGDARLLILHDLLDGKLEECDAFISESGMKGTCARWDDDYFKLTFTLSGKIEDTSISFNEFYKVLSPMLRFLQENDKNLFGLVLAMGKYAVLKVGYRGNLHLNLPISKNEINEKLKNKENKDESIYDAEITELITMITRNNENFAKMQIALRQLPINDNKNLFRESGINKTPLWKDLMSGLIFVGAIILLSMILPQEFFMSNTFDK